MENIVKEKGNSKGIITVILFILLLAAVGFICYDKLLKKDVRTWPVLLPGHFPMRKSRNSAASSLLRLFAGKAAYRLTPSFPLYV